jgi:Domain of unknown function (DUF4442)
MDKSGFLKKLNSGWMMRWFMFLRLPGAWFMRVQLVSCDGKTAVVKMPYSWRTQNPFNSIYFAAQCAAGEYSTGVLALYALHGEQPVSMLVTHVSSEYYKKASQTIYFTCEEGEKVQNAVKTTLATGEPVTLQMMSTGRFADGTEVSKVWITWSFKRKEKRN